MISPPSPILCTIGGFSIHYYGVFMFAAMIAAVKVITVISRKYYKDIDVETILDVFPIVIIFSIIGARMYYVLMDWAYYSHHLSEILALWNGGMSIHGGILGGVISGICYTLIKKNNFLKYADVFAYGLTIGQAIGRFGNYFNCEAFGKPCNIPFLKLYIPPEHRPLGFEEFSYFHPAFLYETLWNLLVFFVLFFFVRKYAQNKPGIVFFSYLILYSTGRFFIEWCRLDSVKDIFGIPIAQLVSLIAAAVGVIGVFFCAKKK